MLASLITVLKIKTLSTTPKLFFSSSLWWGRFTILPMAKKILYNTLGENCCQSQSELITPSSFHQIGPMKKGNIYILKTKNQNFSKITNNKKIQRNLTELWSWTEIANNSNLDPNGISFP